MEWASRPHGLRSALRGARQGRLLRGGGRAQEPHRDADFALPKVELGSLSDVTFGRLKIAILGFNDLWDIIKIL